MSTEKQDIRAMIERMQQAYGVDKKQLADVFGCKENTINNWVYYRRIPFEQLQQCRKATGHSMDWLMFGTQQDTQAPPMNESQLIALIRGILSDSIEFGALLEPYQGSHQNVANKLFKEIMKSQQQQNGTLKNTG